MLDFDQASGRTATGCAEDVLGLVRAHGLGVDWSLETHAHADQLFADGDHFRIGNLKAQVLHVPGHTPADMAYVVGDAAFIDDTLFMPDSGTARCDFPGGSSRTLAVGPVAVISLMTATAAGSVATPAPANMSRPRSRSPCGRA